MTPETRPSSDAMNAFAQQLSSPVAALFPGGDGVASMPAQLADLLPVWRIDPDFPVGDARGVSELARPTGAWHHQILVREAPVAYARSKFEEGALHLLSVIPSETAVRLGQVLASIAETGGAEGEFRLLVSPLQRVTTLWSAGEHARFRVIETPRADGFPDPTVPMEEREFLERLRAAPVFRGRVAVRERRAGHAEP